MSHGNDSQEPAAAEPAAIIERVDEMKRVNGLHHITAIAGPAQENLDFYAGVLGMRLVKKSVNQDDPGTYHLFYADAEGRPGSDLTFFPWSHRVLGRAA
jgi:glyoxalase family protein